MNETTVVHNAGDDVTAEVKSVLEAIVRKALQDENGEPKVFVIDWLEYTTPEDFVLEIINDAEEQILADLGVEEGNEDAENDD